jgi:hypothetical protein
MSNQNTEPEVWYRYMDAKTSDAAGVHVFCHEFPVLRHTPKGVVINTGHPYHTEARFVKTGCRKQYAHPTREEAGESFMYRKRAQLRILRAQLDRAQTAELIAKKLLVSGAQPPGVNITRVTGSGWVDLI